VFELYRAPATHRPLMPLTWVREEVVVDGTMGGCGLGWLSAWGCGVLPIALEIVQPGKK